MDRLTSVEWLRMKADGFYNVFEQERFLEAADEIERLREALRTIAMSHLEKDDRNSGWGYCILIAKTALQQKDTE